MGLRLWVCVWVGGTCLVIGIWGNELLSDIVGEGEAGVYGGSQGRRGCPICLTSYPSPGAKDTITVVSFVALLVSYIFALCNVSLLYFCSHWNTAASTCPISAITIIKQMPISYSCLH